MSQGPQDEALRSLQDAGQATRVALRGPSDHARSVPLTQLPVMARYEANIHEADDEYQRLLARIHQLPRESEQIMGLLDDLTRALHTATFFRERLARVQDTGSSEQTEPPARAPEEPPAHTVYAFTSHQEQRFRVIRYTGTGDYTLEILSNEGWQTYPVANVNGFYLLQLLGPSFTPQR